MLKKVLPQPWNALCGKKIVFTLQVYFARSDSFFSFLSIFCIFRQEKWMIVL